MVDGTKKFKVSDDAGAEMKYILSTVYDALREKGYDPINQIVGYILLLKPHIYHKSSQCQKPHPQTGS